MRGSEHGVSGAVFDRRIELHDVLEDLDTYPQFRNGLRIVEVEGDATDNGEREPEQRLGVFFLVEIALQPRSQGVRISLSGLEARRAVPDQLFPVKAGSLEAG